MFYFRNKFNEIIKAAYIHILKQTLSFLRKPLDSTRLPPRFAIAINKSTRITNQAIMVILPCNGQRVAMPLDAPLVYECVDNHGSIIEGTGQDLATQIFDVLTIKLGLTPPELSYLRGRFSFNFTMSRRLFSISP